MADSLCPSCGESLSDVGEGGCSCIFDSRHVIIKSRKPSQPHNPPKVRTTMRLMVERKLMKKKEP